MSKQSMPDALPDALQKTKGAQETLEASARELLVVNEVLKQEIPEPVMTSGEVAAALEKSESVQSDIEQVAGHLDDVGKALAEEVARRKVAERDLKTTKADLAETQSKLDDANDRS